MDFQVTDTTYLNWTGDCLILGITEDALPLSGTLSELNAKFSGLLQELIDEADFKAKAAVAPRFVSVAVRRFVS